MQFSTNLSINTFIDLASRLDDLAKGRIADSSKALAEAEGLLQWSKEGNLCLTEADVITFLSGIVSKLRTTRVETKVVRPTSPTRAPVSPKRVIAPPIAAGGAVLPSMKPVTSVTEEEDDEDEGPEHIGFTLHGDLEGYEVVVPVGATGIDLKNAISKAVGIPTSDIAEIKLKSKRVFGPTAGQWTSVNNTDVFEPHGGNYTKDASVELVRYKYNFRVSDTGYQFEWPGTRLSTFEDARIAFNDIDGPPEDFQFVLGIGVTPFEDARIFDALGGSPRLVANTVITIVPT